jgi:ribosomal protein L7/L12
MPDNDSERLARLEQKVDYLIAYLGIDPADIAAGRPPVGGRLDVAPASELDDAALGPVYDAVRRGKKVLAIKLYRELTGVGLADAKDAVDAIGRDS